MKFEKPHTRFYFYLMIIIIIIILLLSINFQDRKIETNVNGVEKKNKLIVWLIKDQLVEDQMLEIDNFNDIQEKFKAKYDLAVEKGKNINWDNALMKLKIELLKPVDEIKPDIIQVGSTWISEFENEQLYKKKLITENGSIYKVPIIYDERLIFYWHDKNEVDKIYTENDVENMLNNGRKIIFRYDINEKFNNLHNFFTLINLPHFLNIMEKKNGYKFIKKTCLSKTFEYWQNNILKLENALNELNNNKRYLFVKETQIDMIQKYMFSGEKSFNNMIITIPQRFNLFRKNKIEETKKKYNKELKTSIEDYEVLHNKMLKTIRISKGFKGGSFLIFIDKKIKIEKNNYRIEEVRKELANDIKKLYIDSLDPDYFIVNKFKITEKSLDKFKKLDLPDQYINNLRKKILNKEFSNNRIFLNEIKCIFDNSELYNQYSRIILKNSLEKWQYPQIPTQELSYWGSDYELHLDNMVCVFCELLMKNKIDNSINILKSRNEYIDWKLKTNMFIKAGASIIIAFIFISSTISIITIFFLYLKINNIRKKKKKSVDKYKDIMSIFTYLLEALHLGMDNKLKKEVLSLLFVMSFKNYDKDNCNKDENIRKKHQIDNKVKVEDYTWKHVFGGNDINENYKILLNKIECKDIIKPIIATLYNNANIASNDKVKYDVEKNRNNIIITFKNKITYDIKTSDTIKFPYDIDYEQHIKNYNCHINRSSISNNTTKPLFHNFEEKKSATLLKMFCNKCSNNIDKIAVFLAKIERQGLDDKYHLGIALSQFIINKIGGSLDIYIDDNDIITKISLNSLKGDE